MKTPLDLRSLIRDVPDFPKPGILFKDVTPLLKHPQGLRAVTQTFAEQYGRASLSAVAGIESRGFIFGAPLAYELGISYLPIRKPGKLPYRTRKVTYALEYGEDALEIHEDAVDPGDCILLVDDLLATGGTAAAACDLIEGLGGKVHACAFVVELDFLQGRKKLPGRAVHSLLSF